MNEQKPKEGATEESLVKLYSEMTGANETCSRAVFIYLDKPKEETTEKETSGPGDGSAANQKPPV
jgi:hypothetical protein